MSHIDTLKVYEEYRAAGLDEKTAKEYTNILENSFMTKVKELKQDFASQKFNTVIGGLILIVMSSSTALMWQMSLDLQVLKTCGVEKRQNK